MSRTESRFDPEKFFLALSDQTRLRLLNLMGDDEVCVCFFVEILNERQSKISRHLAYLRKAGLVAGRKEGQWTHYRITTPANPYAARMLRHIRDWLAQDRAMRRDRERLVKVCCKDELPEALQHAPIPASLRSHLSSCR